jgi:hypothetical protein
MYFECHKIVYLKWPCAGLHMERENLVDLIPPGRKLTYQNRRSWDTICVKRYRKGERAGYGFMSHCE